MKRCDDDDDDDNDDDDDDDDGNDNDDDDDDDADYDDSDDDYDGDDDDDDGDDVDDNDDDDDADDGGDAVKDVRGSADSLRSISTAPSPATQALVGGTLQVCRLNVPLSRYDSLPSLFSEYSFSQGERERGGGGREGGRKGERCVV